jgi:foldase protein PrsA
MVAASLPACGSARHGYGVALPGNAVAQVSSASITKQEFAHWLRIYAAAQGPSRTAGTGPVVVPDPPSFARCIVNLREATPVPAGSKAPTAAQFKQQCQQLYNGLRKQVLGFLITAKWLQDEADALGVKVTDAQVQHSYQIMRRQQFPTAADLRQFTKQTGETLQDIFFRIRLGQLQIAMGARATRRSTVTPAEISAYYNANRPQFALPGARDLKIVETTSQAQAEAALAALHAGQGWAEVANKYSIDESSKNTGGLLQGVEKGQLDGALDKVAFSAPTGVIEGPVKAATADLGYYLVLVTGISPATERPLANASSYIHGTLLEQYQQAALNTFVKHYSSIWKGRTACAPGFQIAQYCS